MLQTELIPASDRSSSRLMVVLHGLGDSMEGYRWLRPAMDLPWMNYLLVNAPDSYYGGFSWYDFAGTAGPGILRSRKLLFEILGNLPGRGFPIRNTLLFGFSQGCLMALDAGLRYPEQLAGLIGISGYVFEPEVLTGELSPNAIHVPVLMTHGTLDHMIPIDPVRDQVKVLTRAGLKVQWHEMEKDHTIAGEEEIELIRLFVNSCFPENR